MKEEFIMKKIVPHLRFETEAKEGVYTLWQAIVKMGKNLCYLVNIHLILDGYKNAIAYRVN